MICSQHRGRTANVRSIRPSARHSADNRVLAQIDTVAQSKLTARGLLEFRNAWIVSTSQNQQKGSSLYCRNRRDNRITAELGLRLPWQGAGASTRGLSCACDLYYLKAPT